MRRKLTGKRGYYNVQNTDGVLSTQKRRDWINLNNNIQKDLHKHSHTHPEQIPVYLRWYQGTSFIP